VRTRSDLVEMRVAATGQLAALLDAHWPGAKAVFADEPDRAELPDSLSHRGLRRAARRKADGRDLRQACLLRSSSRSRAPRPVAGRPAGTTDQALTQAVGDAVLAMVLRALASSLKDLNRPVTTRLGEHPGRKIFTSLPRSGQINGTARGHEHQHAIRILARAWTRVIYRCWLDGTPTDPEQHGNATKPSKAIAA
jgi:hypothetical protein